MYHKFESSIFPNLSSELSIRTIGKSEFRLWCVNSKIHRSGYHFKTLMIFIPTNVFNCIVDFLEVFIVLTLMSHEFQQFRILSLFWTQQPRCRHSRRSIQTSNKLQIVIGNLCWSFHLLICNLVLRIWRLNIKSFSS